MSSGPPTSAAIRTGSLRAMALGMLLLQVVWLFATPPFRGMDEFDHTYRAAAVARGQWVADPEAATRGTGAWLVVPDDIVSAARAECQRLDYTRDHDCVGTPVDDGVRVASGAGRYHPLFYAIVGAPATALDGTAALYAMRAVAILLCWAMFVLALWVTRSWARTRWPFVGLALVTTPVLLYSTAIVAPNGLEMTAAIALWSALIGLAVRSDGVHDRRLLVAVAVAGSVLVTVRALGPLWCLLILATVLAAVPLSRQRLRQILVDSRGWATLAAMVAVTAASAGWVLGMGSHVIATVERDPIPYGERLSLMASEPLLWPLQSIAAFPYRNQPTHVSVYGIFLALGLVGLGLALYRARPRLRRAMLGAIVVSFAVPAFVTFATIEESGLAWQGRYALPYSVGVFLLGALALDREHGASGRLVAWVGAALYAAGQAIGPTLVARDERLLSPGVDNGEWVLVPPAVLAIIAVLGAAGLWLGAALGQHEAEEVADDRPDRSRSVVRASR